MGLAGGIAAIAGLWVIGAGIMVATRRRRHRIDHAAPGDATCSTQHHAAIWHDTGPTAHRHTDDNHDHRCDTCATDLGSGSFASDSGGSTSSSD